MIEGKPRRLAGTGRFELPTLASLEFIFSLLVASSEHVWTAAIGCPAERSSAGLATDTGFNA